MKLKTTILTLLLFLSTISFSQQVSNIHFEQAGKQILIYYDLEGVQDDYRVVVFCSTDNGKTWGQPLRRVSGAVGEGQKPGNNKMISWDVLAEKEELIGEIKFKIEAELLQSTIESQSFDLKLSGLKNGVSLNGKRLTYRKVKNIYRNCPQALQEYKQGRAQVGWGSFVLFGGIIPLGAGIIGIVYDLNMMAGLAVAGMGLAMSSAGYRMIVRGGKLKAGSADTYNSCPENRKETSYNIQFGLTNNGIGLCINF